MRIIIFCFISFVFFVLVLAAFIIKNEEAPLNVEHVLELNVEHIFEHKDGMVIELSITNHSGQTIAIGNMPKLRSKKTLKSILHQTIFKPAFFIPIPIDFFADDGTGYGYRITKNLIKTFYTIRPKETIYITIKSDSYMQREPRPYIAYTFSYLTIDSYIDNINGHTLLSKRIPEQNMTFPSKAIVKQYW